MVKNHPNTLGNVWMLRESERGLEYLSDQYFGRVMGYEDIEHKTLAQTSEIALVTLAIGSGVNSPRHHDEYYDWHVVDHTLQGGSPSYSAASHAIINAKKCDETHAALHTHFAIDCAKPGTTEDHLKPDGDYYKSILHLIDDAKSNADLFGKSLFVDCVKVSVLSGQSNLTSNSADYLIAAFIHELRADICAKTGQATFPKFLISPFNDTGSELCLAEGQLDVNHPTLGIIVTSPQYWLEKRNTKQPTLSDQAQVILDELHVVALREVQAGRTWFCPSMQRCYRGDDDTVRIEFSAMGDLVQEGAGHLFKISQNGADIPITGIEIEGKTVTVTFDASRGSPDQVRYAWGSDFTYDELTTAGKIRDSFECDSIVDQDLKLHRYALSARKEILPWA